MEEEFVKGVVISERITGESEKMEIILLIVLVIESIRDIKSRQIWIPLPISIIAAEIFFQAVQGEIQIKELIVIVMLVIVLSAISMITKEALGMGDVWMMGSVLVVLGIISGLECIYISFVLAGIYGGGCWLKKRNKNVEIPFVPFLLVGSVGGLWLQ